MIPNIIGHHKTTRPPNEFYGLFDKYNAGIFGSTLHLHVGYGMANLCSGIDALFENKIKVNEGNTDFRFIWESHMVALDQFMRS